jgi:hypothetical protein
LHTDWDGVVSGGADDDSWTHVKRFIAGSDYYVVIVGGRYGSKGPTGRSYPEMEYDYAVGAGLPTLAFLHKDPGTIPANKTDPTDEGKAALVAFRAKNERARHAKYWISSAELAGTVTLGMASLMKIKPRVGWVRADLVPDGEGRKDELLRLRREIDSLNGELAVASNRAAPEGVDDLAQGSDTTNITVEFESPGIFSLDVRWDSLMRAVLPQTFGGGAPPEAVGAAVASLVQREG